jgi:hypothetical protein
MDELESELTWLRLMSSKHGNEALGPIKDGEFLDHTCAYHVLKEFVLWSL